MSFFACWWWQDIVGVLCPPRLTDWPLVLCFLLSSVGFVLVSGIYRQVTGGKMTRCCFSSFT